MKKTHIIWPVLLASSTLTVLAQDTTDNSTGDTFWNHLTFSGRFGLNVSAKFGPRIAPDGGSYNYLDGYKHTDSTGNFDPTGTFPGITQNWGYDNSSRQNQNNTILMTRGTDSLTHSFDGDPQMGAELVYTRQLGTLGKWSYGFDLALNYMNLSMSDDSGYSGMGTQDAFPYFVGTTPPVSPISSGQPYQGRSSGGGFVIGDTPVSSMPVSIHVAGHRQFDADVWGLRFGPNLQHSLGKHADLSLVGGLAVVAVDGRGSWSETLTVNGVKDPTHSGSGSGNDVLFGYYVGANLALHLSKRWDLNGGAQFQDVGTYTMALGSRQAELDLSQSVFVTLGVSFKF